MRFSIPGWIAVCAALLLLSCGGSEAPPEAANEQPETAAAESSAEEVSPGQSVGPAAVKGAGSTFVYPILRRWSRRYYPLTEVEVVYDAVGSAAGLDQLDQGLVTFAATDIPLPLNELERRGYVQWPIIAGAIVPVVNLLLKSGEVVLDGPALASIYLGEIQQWNAPRLERLNQGVALPDSGITVVQRGDASGTAYNFSEYLAQVSLAWRQRLGVWSSSARPVGVSALGNSGVAELVESIPNSIGYVSFAYAREHSLVHANMVNRDGAEVAPTIETFRAAMSGAQVADSADMTVSISHAAGGSAWPIIGTTYIVVKKPAPDPEKTAEALRFFSWCYQSGAAEAEELLYVAMPDGAARRAEQRWAADLEAASELLARTN